LSKSGEIANGTTITDGFQYVSGGLVSGTTISSLGWQVLYSGGTAVDTFIGSYAVQVDYGVASNSTITSGAQQ
jgi:autotransporter passenger strand-loop-strand repeat protein